MFSNTNLHMKSLIIFLFCTIIFISNLIGQCVIRGKVSDKNGESLVGVNVYVKSKMSIAVSTDLNGDYSLKLPESGTEIIVVRYISYQTIEDTIKCSKGIKIKNYILEPVVNSLSTVVVTAKAYNNNDIQLENIQKRSSSTIDYISAETIKKTGDANVGSAVARITGVSTTSSGLITVRGVGDRYVKTTINGSRIPTLDPFTNNIKLDLFPSSLIDNIIITKTARPDLPGDWAGAYLSIETKDYPDSIALNFETSIGYNQQSTFKDVVSSERSSTDWLGYDNGLRDYNHNNYVQYNNSPSTYQYFAALGLSNYFSSIGVTNTTPWNDTYYKLGLIQLGLLGNAQFNDQTAFQNAKNQFTTLAYEGKAYNLLNSNAVISEKNFPNNWNTVIRQAPLSNTQNFSIGNQTTLFGKTLGYIIGFRYYSSMQYDPNSIKNNIEFQSNISDNTTSSFTKYQKVSKEINGWSGLLKFAYKLNNNNNISLLFLPNVIGTNNIRDAEYVVPASNDPTNNPPILTFSKYQYYESRKQFIYQLKTEHYLPKKKIKIEFNASYTNGKSDAPDSKNLTYQGAQGSLPDNYSLYFIYPTNLNRYFRYLTDNVFDSRVSAEIPLSDKPDLVRKLKIGGGYLYNHIENKSYVYQFVNGSGFVNPTIGTLSKLNPDSIFDIVTIQNQGASYRSSYGYYYKFASPSDNFFGNSEIISGYAMLDYAIIPSVRLSGGLRIEKAKIYTDCFLFDSLGLASNDFRRIITDVWGNTINAQPGDLQKISYLPSINVLYQIQNTDLSQTNLRLNYSQTVARPSIRELSENTFYDFESNSYVKGNSQLKMVKINNFDLRLEKYSKSGDNISFSIFYKDFINHIELTNWGFVLSWLNNPNKTSLTGIEIEGKKNLSKHFEFKANLTLVNSKTTLTGGTMYDLAGHIFNLKGGERPMFGQAPYIFNTMLSYNGKKHGIVATLSYNLQGSKLVIVTDITKPDIYELPRNIFDFKISKIINKHFSASLKIMDILNSTTTRAYLNVNNESYFKYLWNDITNKNNSNIIYSKYKYGGNYIVSLAYKL